MRRKNHELQAENDRLRAVFKELDDLTGFDYPTMPERVRAEIHKVIREILVAERIRHDVGGAA